MAREFSRPFYKSKKWRDVREYYFNKMYGICEICGSAGEEVHHMTWLRPDNIDDINITLHEDNLQVLCRVCHVNIHKRKTQCKGAKENKITFDEEGNPIRINRE